MKRLPALLATLPAGSGVSAKSRLALYCASGSARLIGVLVRQVPLDGSKQDQRSEEHTSELQSLMRISYAVFCLKKKKKDHYELRRPHNDKKQRRNQQRFIN